MLGAKKDLLTKGSQSSDEAQEAAKQLPAFVAEVADDVHGGAAARGTRQSGGRFRRARRRGRSGIRALNDLRVVLSCTGRKLYRLAVSRLSLRRT